jgi:AGZA family xanthine/uracil permease-like MFS transporter
MLSRLFRLKHFNTTPKQEIIAGVSTFFSMAYIAILMPTLLSVTGMNNNALFVIACVVCIFSSLLIAFIANLPIAIGPAVAILAYFSTVVVQLNHFTWQQGILAVFISSVGLIIVTAFNLQKKIIASLPDSFFSAICAGLGLFLVLIALKNAQLFNISKSIFSMHWNPWTPGSWVFILSLIITILLDRLRVPGAFIIAIILSTLTSLLVGFTDYQGTISIPPSINANLFTQDWHAISNPAIWQSALCLLLITLFDNTGTLVGLTQTIGTMNQTQARKAISKGVIANALSTFFASLISSPCTSTYLESATGIRAGGKTGLTALTVSLCFILLLFFSPLVTTVPSQATSAVLLYIGLLMFSKISHIPFNLPATAWGCVATIILIPLSFSVVEGLGAGLLFYTFLSPFTQKSRQDFNRKTIWLTALLALFMLSEASRRLT